MKWTAVCTFLALMLSAASAREIPKQSPEWKTVSFSILEDYRKGDDLDGVREDFKLMRELRVRQWRGSWSWIDYEPERGRYDLNWLHAFVRLGKENGVTLRPWLGYTPWWATLGSDDGSLFWNRPPKISDWAKFTGTIAKEFKNESIVRSFELYNEENAPLWWHGSPQEYRTMFEAGARAIRTYNPHIEIQFGGFTHPDPLWIANFCADPVVKQISVRIAFHAYPETWTAIGVEKFLDHESGGFEKEFLARASHCGKKPVWVNETGYATYNGKTERDQANWWARAIPTFFAASHVEHIGIFRLRDLPGHRKQIGGQENYDLGIIYPDRKKKLAFNTLKMLIGFFNGRRIILENTDILTKLGRDDVYAHTFRRADGVRLFFAWTSDKDAKINVSFPPSHRVREYSLEGTVIDQKEGSQLRSLQIGKTVRIFTINPR